MRVPLSALLVGAAACASAGMPPPPQIPTAVSAPPTTTATTTTVPATAVPPRRADGESPGSGVPSGQIAYQCTGGAQIQATYVGATATVRWNGRSYPLTVDPAAGDGVLFTSPTYQWRIEGKRATLIERGRPVATDCRPT